MGVEAGVTDTRREHWDDVYRNKQVDRVSWYQPQPQPSLDALTRLGAKPDQSLIDIGGGASSLTAKLAEAGWSELAVLDISAAALDHARTEMGEGADDVEWIVADVTEWRPARRYDIWHDRAVFHFLTEAGQREAYRRALAKGLEKGGLIVIATFALDGPEKCSGLPVQRYDAQDLSQELGDEFALLEHWRETHRTPWDSEQSFTWTAFRKETT